MNVTNGASITGTITIAATAIELAAFAPRSGGRRFLSLHPFNPQKREEHQLMKKNQRSIQTAIVTLALALGAAGSAHAAGCMKGAVVGGVAGHYAGHHAVIGAVGGCIAGRHLAKKHEEQVAAQRQAAVAAHPVQ